jgi:hypothetical protein
MSTSREKKRPRQNVGNESQAKRRRTTSLLKLLQDHVEEKSRRLGSALTLMLKVLPNDDSANDAHEFIDARKSFLELIVNDAPVSEDAEVFEIKLDAVFPDEITSHVKPSE